ncbi:alpha/beta fold hydrolase [Hyphomonas sp.]|uniref:alpha/beta fold hydrolase n=1 Tax=Hyphomonas sp. TaxID=87 RepID=UPI003F6FF305
MTAQETQIEFPGGDGLPISAYHWSASRPPRAICVVAHGMGEHAKRYEEPLQPLLKAGIDIYAPDHRGHGRTAKHTELGEFGSGGFAAVVNDLVVLIDRIRTEHDDIPIILLGHSMGSFAAQLLLLDYAEKVDAVALSGSAALDQVAAGISDPDILGLLNSPFQPARTPFDWLSRDETQVDLYTDDPLCGFELTPASFGSLFANAARMADPGNFSAISPSLPIYLFSGSDDPLAGKLNAWHLLVERYRQAGLNIQSRLYEGARHEVLNETNRADVCSDLLKWIEGALAPPSPL